jgi:hypothetical protein
MNRMAVGMFGLAVSLSATACNLVGRWDSSHWGGCNNSPSGCGGGYSDSAVSSRDILSEIQGADEQEISEQGERFAARFALTTEQGVRVIRAARDWSLLQERSAQDLEEFSQRVYGVHPAQIASAMEHADLGNRGELEQIMKTAASHFGTDPGTMKEIVEELHSEALREAGIDLGR